MIASVRGIVQSIGEDQLLLEVGGVGLRISVPLSVIEDAPAPGRSLFLHTYLAVREDALNLYGFSSLEEREAFELLIQVSGVGPRLALAILSHLSLDMLRNAISSNQPEALVLVPGIGQKSAERIVFHLKDRLAPMLEPAGEPSEADSEVLTVLMALGYSMHEAQAALQALSPDAPEDVEERIRLALQHFARV